MQTCHSFRCLHTQSIEVDDEDSDKNVGLKARWICQHECFRPLVKSAYQKMFFLFLNQNICGGYSKEPSQ